MGNVQCVQSAAECERAAARCSCVGAVSELRFHQSSYPLYEWADEGDFLMAKPALKFVVTMLVSMTTLGGATLHRLGPLPLTFEPLPAGNFAARAGNITM